MRPLGIALLLSSLAIASPHAAAVAQRPDTVVVFTAASLAVPFRVALDSFARRTGTVVRQESGASL
jgi:ABC-type molybdate transport system substrate-binding protein